MEQWHPCNPSSVVDPHQVLAWWNFFHYCSIERIPHDCMRSHFITRWNRHCTRKLYPFCEGTHSSTVLVCMLYLP